ncbi:MAG TPA: hypothetical protein VK620_26660, partial [Bradyrhizobium sp.]|nr:hypothetical protein [Bradyrhizobium sp.]
MMWSTHSRRIDPISRSAKPFCQGETSHAKTVRHRVLGFLTKRHPGEFTADEIAAALDENILSVRPRVSELLRSGLIEPTA